MLFYSANGSIARISEMLRMMGYPNDSTGMVSQQLKSFGSCLSNTLNVDKPCLIYQDAIGNEVLRWLSPLTAVQQAIILNRLGLDGAYGALGNSG